MVTSKYYPTVEAIEKASGVLEEILEPTPFQKNQDELHQLFVMTSEKLKELK